MPDATKARKIPVPAFSATLYGIPNCNQVKKARLWLENNAIPYVFHDFNRLGLDRARLESWLNQRSWSEMVNRKGTTWRKLAADEQPDDAATATALMLTKTSVIKRPVLEINRLEIQRAGQVSIEVGFSEARYRELLAPPDEFSSASAAAFAALSATNPAVP